RQVGVVFRRAPRALRELAKRLAGAKQLDVVLHLLVRKAIKRFLLAAGAARTAEERPRHIGVVTEWTDHVSVDPDKIARTDAPKAALSIPRIGAWARGQNPRLHVLAAHLAVGCAQQRPQLDFGSTRLD